VAGALSGYLRLFFYVVIPSEAACWPTRDLLLFWRPLRASGNTYHVTAVFTYVHWSGH
jgi:hypothetical protein